MALTTPGVSGKLLEFLENSWNFEIFFQGPGKLLEKQIITLKSWKIHGILWKKFKEFISKRKPAEASSS